MSCEHGWEVDHQEYLWLEGASDGSGSSGVPAGVLRNADPFHVGAEPDLTGDGFPDLVVSWRPSLGDPTSYPGRVAVYPLDLDGTVLATDYTGAILFDEVELLLSAQVPTGDYNGDGIHDLCVINLTADTVSLFYGPIVGERMESDADATILRAPDAELMGFDHCGSIGDINGDGLDDFAVGATDTGAFAGGTLTWYGGISIFTTPPQGPISAAEADIIFRIDRPSSPMTDIFGPVGDLNGDGFDDVVYSGWRNSEAYIFYGPIERTGEILHHDADATITGAGFTRSAAET